MGVSKQGWTVPISNELLSDSLRGASAAMRREIDRMVRRILVPWEFPDGWRGWPDTIILDDGIDRLERVLVRLIDRLAVVLRRVTDAWSVLTGAASLDDGEEW